MLSAINLALGVVRLVRMFMDWAQRRGYIDDGMRQQWQKEIVELDRTMKVTDEEDARAHTDTDAVLDDELKRPLD